MWAVLKIVPEARIGEIRTAIGKPRILLAKTRMPDRSQATKTPKPALGRASGVCFKQDALRKTCVSIWLNYLNHAAFEPRHFKGYG